jgi:hypothetical protein
MDPKRFDALTRSLVTALDRRRAIQAGLAGLLSGAVAARGLAGAEATDKKTCSPDECTGDATCQKQGGPDCVCNKDEAGAETNKPAKGTCGARGPVTCSPKACEPGAAGDGFCQTHGGDGCVCVRDEAQGSLSGTPATGTCGTGGGPVTCLVVGCMDDTDCAQGVPGGCVCQDGTCGTPDCEPRTCAEIGADCGVQPDGCGGTVNCGTCEPGFRCDNGMCREKPCRRDTQEGGLPRPGVRHGLGQLRRRVHLRPLPEGRAVPRQPLRAGQGQAVPGQGAGRAALQRQVQVQERPAVQQRPLLRAGRGRVGALQQRQRLLPGLTCARKAGGRHKTCLRKPIGRATISEADITAW